MSYGDKGKYWQRALSLISGCSHVSNGCANCWLAQMDYRFKNCNKECANCPKPSGCLTIKNFLTGKIEWTGNILFHEDRIGIPLKVKKPTVFAIWSDFGLLPLEIMNRVITMIRGCSRHTFIILTKRPENILPLWSWGGSFNKGEYLDNIYWGVSVENQKAADERIPLLLKLQGKLILSVEPMLEKIDIRKYLAAALGESDPYRPTFQQVIVGCESGKNARPTDNNWIRDLRDQCEAAKIPLFIKQINFNGKINKGVIEI